MTMKQVSNAVTIALSVLSCLSACTLKDDLTKTEQHGITPATRSFDSVKGTHYSASLITRDMIPVVLKNYLDLNMFKDLDNYSLEVICEDGKDLIFVVNFDDGGWVLISGVFLMDSPIIAFSFSGVFEPEDIHSPETSFWLDATKQSITESIEKVYLENSGEADSNTTRGIDHSSFARSFGDSYFWVMIPLDTSITTTTHSTVSPLLSTKWGQEYPWNYKCPTIDDERCLTGCVAVAFAQEFYYLHNYLEEPTCLYHQIDTCYDWRLSYYSPMHNMTNRTSFSPRWADMPLINPGYQTTGTNYVGDLMTEIGQQVLMRYSYHISEAALNTSIFPNYGLSVSSSDFDPFMTITQLNDSIPIIIGSHRAPPDVGGHAWVIDGHYTTQTTQVTTYQWRRLPEEFLIFYWDYICYNDRDMQKFHPDVVENQIVYEYQYYYTYSFSMNWGWDGDYDGYYSMSTISYPYQPRMLYGFQTQ